MRDWAANVDRVDDAYRERRDRFAAEARALERRSRRFGSARLAAFSLALAAFLAPVFLGRSSLFWTAAMVVFIAGFALLVVIHARIDRARGVAVEKRRLNDEARARRVRDWREVPEPRLATEGRLPVFARDLGLFGNASLWKLLGTVSTPLGKETLRGWLLTPAEPEEVQ